MVIPLLNNMSSNKSVLYDLISSILTMVRGKRVFIFAESDEGLEQAYKKIKPPESTSINTFTKPRDVLEDVNAHPRFKYSEGYLVENQDKKSTTKILSMFIHQSAPRIKLQTIRTN